MRKLYKISLLIIIGMIGYSLGNFIPMEIFNPNFTDENLTKSDYYRLLIAIISAIITFFAVLVALFKDDLRELWKRPIIQFCTPDEMTIEDLNSSLESETASYIKHLDMSFSFNTISDSEKLFLLSYLKMPLSFKSR